MQWRASYKVVPAQLPTAISAAWRFGWGLLLLLLAGAAADRAAAELVLDDFAYTNTVAARAAWLAGSAPPVTMADSGTWGSERAMVLPCDFATRASRCYWDRNVSLNLTNHTDIALEVFASDPGAFSGFTLYFRSGGGWYGCSASVALPGWQTLRFSQGSFIAEGTPAGWNRIDGIRLSPWKAAARNTELVVRELRAYTPTVLLVRDTATSNPTVVTETIDRHVDYLGRYQVSCGVITTAGLEAGQLRGSRFAVLPYNENLSSNALTQLELFVAGGGKLLVYYLLPARLQALLGLRATGWAPGDYAAWTFTNASVAGLPARVAQASWNITIAETNGAWNSRALARWDNSQGQPTGHTAWFASDHGYFLSHVLLGDDADQKSYVLLCLLAHHLPELWNPAAQQAIEGIGVFGGYLSYAEAEAAIRLAGASTLRASLVDEHLRTASAARSNALALVASGQHADAIALAHAAQESMRRAYLLAQKPVTPEFRAFWEHHATGPFPGDWPRAVDMLASNGVTAVFPNMLWGGLAYYASSHLPRAAEYTQYGDQIAACANAAHARGLQVHVWKVNWNLGGAPQSFIDALRAANRTQVTTTGTAVDWLCPSHPDNHALETNSLAEVVRNYDIDGIHFDYIRYPDGSCCYCSGCASRFQSDTGRVVNQWPADVLAAGSLRTAFLNWRRSQITRLVAAVAANTRALKPNVKISAAVFPDAPSAYDDVGQDWRAWIDAGLVDFLCPMDYTTDYHSFTNLVGQQLGYAAGRIPIYPGIGAHQLSPEEVVAQVQATRKLQTGGFIVFELSATTPSSLLPALRAGVLAPDEPDADADLLADAWEDRWFGGLGTAGPASDTDADQVPDTAEYVLGTDPTVSGPGLRVQIQAGVSGVEIMVPAIPVEGAGYRNARRYYRLERAVLGTGAPVWESAPGAADTTVDVPQTVIFVAGAASGGAWIYRVRTWLQQP